MEGFRNEYTDSLMETIIRIETKEDCYRFFEDICTIKELLDMGKRLEAARLLSQGMNYQEIIDRIGISTATLSRVNKALNYGAGGYRKFICGEKPAGTENPVGGENRPM